MELHQVRYFLALVDTMNFTRAAEMCNVSQPSLTRAVRKLEDELGGDLVNRERSNTHLTELGRVMTPMLRLVYEGTQNLKAAAGSFHEKTLASIRIAVSQSIDPRLLAAPLYELARAIPNLEINLERMDAGDIPLRLRDGDVDLAIAGRIETNWDRLDQWKLFSEGFSMIVLPSHELASRQTVVADDLEHVQVISRSFCEDGLPAGADKAPIGPRHSVSTQSDLMSFVEAGIGAAITPNSAATPSTLVRIPISDENLNRSVFLFTVAGRRRSPACGVFLKLLRSIDWPTRIEDQPRSTAAAL